MSEIGRKIREAREARRMSQAELARVLGGKQQAIDRIERGETKFSRLMEPAMEFLGIEDDEANPKPILLPSHEIVPIYSTIGNELTSTIVGHANRPVCLAGVPDAYAFHMRGTSMDPIFRPGDLLVIHPHIPPRAGDRIVLRDGSNFEVASLVSEDDQKWVVSVSGGTVEISKEKYGIAHKVVAVSMA